MTSVSVLETNVWPRFWSSALSSMKVFDDAVVDDDDFACAVRVGVSC